MSQLNFTEEERSLIAAMTSPRQSVGYRIGAYASALVPVTLIAVYGLMRDDVVAVTVAFGGLLIYVCWQAWGDLRYVAVWAAICRKIAEHEKASQSASQESLSETVGPAR